MQKILLIFNILIVFKYKDNNYKNLMKNNIHKVFDEIFLINNYIIIDYFILLKNFSPFYVKK